ncbi:MAG: Uma2 family endonuclease [Planctomycetota bacterium]
MSTALKRLTVEEYLALEAQSDVRHEYYDGELFAMAGGTLTHSLIKVNAGSAMSALLRERGCLVCNSDMMVFCPTGLRTYPDLSIVCERPRCEDDREVVLLNPLAIFEVLSETTEAYGRGKKFDHYQSIASLREYVLVSQDRPHVDRFTRQEGGEWLLAKYEGLQATVTLPSLGCSVPMAEVFAGVDLGGLTERSPAGEQNPRTEVVRD